VVNAPSNKLYRRVPLPTGYHWGQYESRVLRFRLDLADLKADRAPLLLGVRCAEESLPLEDQDHWRRSFIYRFYGKGNHRNWGDLETTPDGVTGRRLFAPYALISKTRSLRSAPFRLSFDNQPGEAIELELLNDHECTLHFEMWTGRGWLSLATYQIPSDGETWRSSVALPDVDLTPPARFFPKIVPDAPGAPGS
jgi:hypothetical protein